MCVCDKCCSKKKTIFEVESFEIFKSSNFINNMKMQMPLNIYQKYASPILPFSQSTLYGLLIIKK